MNFAVHINNINMAQNATDSKLPTIENQISSQFLWEMLPEIVWNEREFRSAVKSFSIFLDFSYGLSR